MFTLPFDVLHVLVCFAPLCSKRVWEHATVLLIGAMLAPGKRTVTSALHVMGLRYATHFQNDHRVLNRAVWARLSASRLLLGVLVAALAPTGRLVRGRDDHIERRRGEKRTAQGISRDPVRSSRSHFVNARGLRWLRVMRLGPIPWANSVWALPFLPALCPSERSHQERGRRHTTLTDRARQRRRLGKRWQPPRALGVVADRSFAALEWLQAVRDAVTVVTRLRLDAARDTPAPERQPGQMGRPRTQGKRLPTLTHLLSAPQTVWRPVTIQHGYGQGPRGVETTTGTGVWEHTGLPAVPIRWVLVRAPQGKCDAQAFRCTALSVEAPQVLAWFVQRWQVEGTFEAARAHLGVEPQRQWSDKAIARPTPSVLGLYSLSTLLARQILQAKQRPRRPAAWYAKKPATFSDTLAWVRRHVWSTCHFSMSTSPTDMQKVPRALWER
jgi:hypothetical protein